MLRRTFITRVLSVLAILLTTNVVLGVVFGLFFPIGYFAEKSVSRIVSDLTFIEGAAIFFAGAILAFSYSRIGSRVKALMIVGASMIVVSIGVGTFALYF